MLTFEVDVWNESIQSKNPTENALSSATAVITGTGQGAHCCNAIAIILREAQSQIVVKKKKKRGMF